MTVAQLAYAAGIIDGEGCIHLGTTRAADRQHPKWKLRLLVGNTDFRLLFWLKDAFGGESIHRRQHKPWQKPSGYWQVEGGRAESVIQAVRPYLILKAEQAELALAFRALVRQARPGLPTTAAEIAAREALRLQFKVLNQRGISA